MLQSLMHEQHVQLSSNYMMHRSRQLHTQSAFTLIELLVVIAIIGVLASVVLASLNTAREKARDAKRLSEMKEMEKALNIYYADNGHYPYEVDANTGSTGTICTSCTGGINTILKQYMGGVPQDPINDSTNYYYYDGRQGCGGNPNKAVLIAHMENTSLSNRNKTICTSWGGEGQAGSTNSYMIVLGDGQ